MAKLSMKLKQKAEPKFSTRAYTRCRLCGRPHSVLRKQDGVIEEEERQDEARKAAIGGEVLAYIW